MPVKRVISHNDLDGNPVSEAWYFSLGKTDALEMDLAHHENVEQYLTDLIKDAKKNSREILKVWKELLFSSVGQREGNLLVKDESIVRKFRYSGAYEQLLGELMDEDDAGASFFVSIMPQDIQERIADKKDKQYTKDEMLSMTDAEFDSNIGTDLRVMTKEQQLVAFQRRTGKAA